MMEGKAAVNKQLKLAACFFLLSVVLWGVSVEACQQEDDKCSSSLLCCEGLECVEVSPGVFQCEPECCEEHMDHWCKAHERECCDDEFEYTLTCDCEPNADPQLEGTCINYTNKIGEVCDPNTAICARRGKCVDLDGDGTYHCQCNQDCKDDCDCCVNAKCQTDGTCLCNKQENDPCDPNACVPECCERECVQVDVGVYQCKTV